jgi:O-antigen ligase
MNRINFLADKFLAISRNTATITAISAMGIFVLSSLWYGQIWWLYLLAVAVSGTMIILYPETGLYLIVVCTMWFERHFTLQELVLGTGSLKLYPIDIIIAITGLSLVLSFFRHRPKLGIRRFDYPIIAFAALVSFAFANSLFAHGNADLAFSTLKNYILYSIIYVFAVLSLKTESDWKELLRWFAIGGIGLFFFLFYGMYAGEGVWSEFTPLSTAGVRLVAGTHVFYMVLFSFWVLSFYLWRALNVKEDNPRLILSILGLIFIGIVISLVRHLWVAIFLIMILWLIIFSASERWQLFRLIGKSIVAVILAGLVFSWGYSLVNGHLPREFSRYAYILKERINVANVVELNDSSFGWRWAAWQGGAAMWARQPVFGIGLGQSVVFPYEVTFFEIFTRDLHNDYLGILLQLGLVGAGIVIWWFGVILQTLSRLWRKRMELDIFRRRLTFTAGCWALLFMVCFSVSVYWDVNLFIIWWWLALSAVRWLLVESFREAQSYLIAFYA